MKRKELWDNDFSLSVFLWSINLICILLILTITINNRNRLDRIEEEEKLTVYDLNKEHLKLMLNSEELYNDWQAFTIWTKRLEYCNLAKNCPENWTEIPERLKKYNEEIKRDRTKMIQEIIDLDSCRIGFGNGTTVRLFVDPECKEKIYFGRKT